MKLPIGPYLIAPLVLAASLGMIGGAVIGVTVDDDGPTSEIGTALAVERELHCQEDEDIVISLAPNGLPIGYCRQVIER